MKRQILNGQYVMLKDSVSRSLCDVTGFTEGSIVTLIQLSPEDDIPEFRDNVTKETLFVGMKSVELLEGLTMKKGDKFIVTGGDYHGFKEGETVEYVGEYSDTASDFSNGKFPQIVRHIHVEPVENDLDSLVEALAQPVRTEHIPRNTDNFSVTITEEALKDDIPFIIDAYYTNSLSLREVASLLGVDEKTIRRRMSKHGVPTRTVSQAIRAKYSL